MSRRNKLTEKAKRRAIRESKEPVYNRRIAAVDLGNGKIVGMRRADRRKLGVA